MPKFTKKAQPAPVAVDPGPVDGDAIELVCPYTGHPITIETIPAVLGKNGHPTLYRATGMFDPGRLYVERQALMYDLCVRDGVPPKFPRQFKVSVRERAEPPANPMADRQTGVSIVGDKAAEVVDELLHESTVRVGPTGG